MHIDSDKALRLLSEGHVIALPTDTVYGLAASVYHQKALEDIFTLKQRCVRKPLVIQVGDVKDVRAFSSSLPKGFDSIAKAFWPGPLTIVIDVDISVVPEVIRCGLVTTGFRVPGHEEVRALLRKSGPLAITSANVSGEYDARTAEEVESFFGVDFPVLSIDSQSSGVPSTVVGYVDGSWKVFREGMISYDKIKDCL
jgi:L-threonylcarbamoyladenylate synthase